MKKSNNKTIFTLQRVKADTVLCRGGCGNTEKEISKQIGVRDGFLEKVSGAHLSAYVSICQSFH